MYDDVVVIRVHLISIVMDLSSTDTELMKTVMVRPLRKQSSKAHNSVYFASGSHSLGLKLMDIEEL